MFSQSFQVYESSKGDEKGFQIDCFLEALLGVQILEEGLKRVIGASVARSSSGCAHWELR